MEPQERTYPAAWLEQMQEILGPEYPAFLEALQDAPKVSLRYNPAKPGAKFPDAVPVPWCPEGVYLPERPRFVRDPLLHAGAYYVQEASSILIGAAGHFFPGMKVLDLCAAPGGKSTLLSTRVGEEGLVVANEIVGNRARVLEENATRWGATNMVITNNRSESFSSLTHFFDLILVDAPCSGEGMFRKDPDVISHWSPRIVSSCAERQREILENIWPALKPGGQLIYSTCTYNRQENEDIVQWMLDQYPGDVKIEALNFPEEWGLTPGDTQGYDPGMIHTYHAYLHKVKGEGFFLASLKKSESASNDALSRKKSKKSRKGRPQETRKRQELSPKALKTAKTFLADSFDVELQVDQDEIEAWPMNFASDIGLLKSKLNVFKAGTQVGKGNRDQFIPHHDLAMSPLLADSLPAVELDYENALQYLKRGTVQPPETSLKGWAIARFQGVNLGWMKVLPNRVNIHLPKHWKIRADISNW